jgi:hypothetical protein
MHPDVELRRQILRRRGSNQKLAEELLEKLSTESKISLLRILADDDREISTTSSKLNKLNRMGVKFLCR